MPKISPIRRRSSWRLSALSLKSRPDLWEPSRETGNYGAITTTTTTIVPSRHLHWRSSNHTGGADCSRLRTRQANLRISLSMAFTVAGETSPSRGLGQRQIRKKVGERAPHTASRLPACIHPQSNAAVICWRRRRPSFVADSVGGKAGVGTGRREGESSRRVKGRFQ